MLLCCCYIKMDQGSGKMVPLLAFWKGGRDMTGDFMMFSNSTDNMTCWNNEALSPEHYIVKSTNEELIRESRFN